MVYHCFAIPALAVVPGETTELTNTFEFFINELRGYAHEMDVSN